MDLSLLVDSDEFRVSLARDVAAARDFVRVQTLSLEGDGAGRELADMLLACGAPDRRVAVDTFSKYVVNDKFLLNPRHVFDAGLRREVRETRRMVATLEAGGVPVRYTNPMGPLLVRSPARNHKKLVAIDGRVAYFGGINFSDHNFEWHDLMIRVEDGPAAGFLAEDFDATWRGHDQAAVQSFPGLALCLLDGHHNPRLLDPVLDRIAAARDRIVVVCPYLTQPFCDHLRAARKRGVAVTALSARANNWPLAYRHMLWHAKRSGIEVRLYEGRMLHMKAMLIDDATLIVGSANFDLWSYRFQQELVAVIDEPGLIAAFRERVLEPDLAASTPCDVVVGHAEGRVAQLRLHLLERVSRRFNGG